MALIRWQPWQEMETLRRQFDQLFYDLAPVQREGEATVRPTWAPAIELKGNDTELILKAELPGITADNLDIQVTREAVAIAGEYKSETKSEENHIVRSEFRYGSFRRVVPLPVEVQNDQVKAEFVDGVLTLTLPKVQATRPNVVKVNLTGTAAPATKLPDTLSDKPETGDVWQEPAQ